MGQEEMLLQYCYFLSEPCAFAILEWTTGMRALISYLIVCTHG